MTAQFSIPACLDVARRQRKRWLGSGPWRAEPLAGILDRRHPSRAWHAPETADGEIVAISHPAVAFLRDHALLGQPTPPIRLENGELRFSDAGLVPAQTTRFWSLESAGVLGHDGLVYCPRSRSAVAETARTILRSAGSHPELNFDRPVTHRLAGTSLLLAGPFGHAHYHLLWDLLAKLALLPAALRPGIDHYLLGMPEKPAITGWLRAAGVLPERIVWLTGSSHLQCEQVVFSNLPSQIAQPRPDIRQALRTLLAAPTAAEPQRWLWLSRRRESVRNLAWEEQVLAAFPQFERLDLGAMPATEQIRIFAEARVVAGPHGSGFANLAFASGAGNVVEFFPANHPVDPVYRRLAHIAGWQHAWAHLDFAQPAVAPALIAALRAHLPPL